MNKEWSPFPFGRRPEAQPEVRATKISPKLRHHNEVSAALPHDGLGLLTRLGRDRNLRSKPSHVRICSPAGVVEEDDVRFSSSFLRPPPPGYTSTSGKISVPVFVHQFDQCPKLNYFLEIFFDRNLSCTC